MPPGVKLCHSQRFVFRIEPCKHLHDEFHSTVVSNDICNKHMVTITHDECHFTVVSNDNCNKHMVTITHDECHFTVVSNDVCNKHMVNNVHVTVNLTNRTNCVWVICIACKQVLRYLDNYLDLKRSCQ